jgi:hypothetical protein
MKELGSLENKIKLFTFLGGLMANYFLIKSDIRELYTEKHYEIEHLQYQIEEIKADCCDEKSKEKTKIVYKEQSAVLPNETKIIEHVF